MCPECFQVNFSLLRANNIDFSYFLSNDVIEKVSSIKDLGVTFTYNLNFSQHINNIIKKSFQMFGFMKRILKPMNDPSVYLSLYHVLVRSRLDYCSFVWSPSGQTMRDKLERVQQKFVKFLSFKCKLPTDLSYAERCEYFKLPALDARREMLDLRMVNKILNNQVDCPELLSRIGFGIPMNRSRKRLFVSNHRLRVSQNSPISRSTTLANNVELDVFSPVSMFRRNSASHFSF